MSPNQTRCVSCLRCGTPIVHAFGRSAQRRAPCEVCGGTALAYNVTISDSVSAHDSIRIRQAEAGRKWFLQIDQGASLHRDSGTWSNVLQLIDRRNDRYIKRVVDHSGTVVRDVDESLHAHQGHGSDRTQPKAHP